MSNALKSLSIEQISFEDIKEESEEKAILLDFSEEPDLENFAVTLNGVNLIEFGEIMCLVALPSSGKTSVMEALACASFEDETIDCLGFQLNTQGKKVLVVDTERPSNDCKKSGMRMRKRAVKSAKELHEKIDYFMFSGIKSITNARKNLEDLIESKAYGVVIIDGILDFSASMNEEVSAKDSVIWLRTLAVKNKVAIVTTMHPNKGTKTMAGHLGAFLYRYCRAILFIEKDENGRRCITSEFDQGKLSFSSKSVNFWFEWSDDHNHFVSCQDQEIVKTKKTSTAKNYEEIILKCFDKYNTARNYEELVISLASHASISEKTAKNKITELLKNQVLIRVTDKSMKLNIVNSLTPF
jgi:hypothetical protein